MPQHLRGRDKQFLGAVAEIMFSNPFDHYVEELESLTGQKLGQQSSDHFYVLLKPEIAQVLAKLEAKGITTLADFDNSNERHSFLAAKLFLIYDGLVDEIDELITAQIATPDKTIKVKFAKQAFAQLHGLGLSDAQCEKYFALFFQLRRAYLFILGELKGESPSMQRLRRDLWNNIFTSHALLYVENLWQRMEDFSTLLLGETGSGKGAAARAIGCSGLIPFDQQRQAFSERFTDAFVAINLLEYPESLLESELFGHNKGAFTGAIAQHDGLFKRCSAHGALFLDEIGDVNVSIQIKLLKVLQERRFSPVGSHETHRFSGRVIAATNRDLTELRKTGEFRNDFYYRLSSDVITVPTLRERLLEAPQELDLLVASLVEKLSGSDNPYLTDQVLASLKKHPGPNYEWPGNVRELEQAVRRTILGRGYQGEEPDQKLPDWLQHASAGELSANQLLASYCKMLHLRHGTYEAVAQVTGLDRRTVKKHIDEVGNG